MSGGQDRSVVLCNPYRVTHSTILQKYTGGHGSDILTVKIFPDRSKFISGGLDRCWFLWDVSHAKVLRRYYGHEQRITCMQVYQEDASVVATGSYDTTVRLWDMRSASRAPIQHLSDAKDSISSLYMPSAEYPYWILTTSVDGHVRKYDIRKGVLDDFEMIAPITWCTPIPSYLYNSAYYTVLLSNPDSTVRLFDISHGSGPGVLVNEYRGHLNTSLRCSTALLHSTRQIVSGSEDGRIVVWNISSPHGLCYANSSDCSTILNEASTYDRAVCTVVAHPKKDQIISSSMSGAVSIWDASCRQ